VSEDPDDTQAEHPVQERHEGHHDHHEHQHDAGVAEQFLAGRGDDLLELADDLPDEQGDPREGVAPCGAILLRVRDDILARLVDYLS